MDTGCYVVRDVEPEGFVVGGCGGSVGEIRTFEEVALYLQTDRSYGSSLGMSGDKGPRIGLQNDSARMNPVQRRVLGEIVRMRNRMNGADRPMIIDEPECGRQ